MKNHSIKTLTLLGSLLLATSAPAKAENPYDPKSYWFGFTAGAGGILCLMTTDGTISKAQASEIFADIYKETNTDPELTSYKQDFRNAYEALKENPDCKGVVK
tara:strand:- start:4 stop:312 length:309 start_codon:yes stop_codon:yes gene_type:complete